MTANDLIEAYVTDVARRLPRAQRNDVAFELRALLREELQARAEGAGRDADPAMADRYSSGARSYPEVTRAAILEMHRQVGVARPGTDGIMRRGLMIRHLVMPNGVSGTRQSIDWIASHLPRDTYVNLMSQYRPAFKAADYPALARALARTEYEQAVALALAAGLTRLDIQGWRD